jgi:hypothetical protein
VKTGFSLISSRIFLFRRAGWRKWQLYRNLW